MSDTIKLSELLESGAEALALDAADNKAWGALTISAVCAAESRALRAIAPALVGAVNGVFEHRRKVAEEPEYLHRTDVCEACKLAITLEEAGVTCE